MGTYKHSPGPWSMRIDDTGGQFTGWPSVDNEAEAAIAKATGETK